MLRAFGVAPIVENELEWTTLMPRYNVAPTDQVPVVLETDGMRFVKAMRWGLIHFRTRRMRGRTTLDENGMAMNTPINARAETVHSHGRFKRAFVKRRCVVPAGGFYEWKGVKGERTPYWIHLEGGTWMGLAGLYTWWKSPEGEWVPSCTILTTEPNSFMETIHDRMPVILSPDAYKVWLDPTNQDTSKLQEVLIPYPSAEMHAHRVSMLVNRTHHDGPELIESVT